MKPTGRLVIGVLCGIAAAAAVVALGMLLDDEPAAPVADFVADASAADSLFDTVARRPSVRVLNAAGVPGLAERATDYLRDRGVDVVFFGNAESFGSEVTVVVARRPDPAPARYVARLMGVDSVRVEPDSTLFVDATVRVGKDWP